MIIDIKAHTEKGELSLKQHLAEVQKMNKSRLCRMRPEVQIWNKLFSQEVLSQEPLVVRVEVKNNYLASLLEFENVKIQIQQALFRNFGAEQGRDYTILRGD